ncbi:MAG TPA: peptide-methionine (S)-S-oxide reductase [Hellea balneolensis]|uniref:Peptide methionine sulfoxide reductase MsrA n=1 Tax=Hellea balneolensis TaxID=287478 RepID=A0A7C5QS01_9PROT|nr:peptide-methionine (S)-S-oxide reductase [Hellea balneolensis]
MKKLFLLSFAVISACSGPQTSSAQTPDTLGPQYAQAIFAGGCFWCVEADFEKLPGVIEAVSGYAGGHVDNPSYKQVSHGGTGHYEVAKIIYDPSKISYADLLEYYWTHVDPTDDGGQFCDRGHSYKTAIFATPAQMDIAKASKKALMNSGRLKDKVVTPVLPAPPFYKAETYHQDYYKKNPIRYKYYRTGCGRDRRIKQIWGHH